MYRIPALIGAVLDQQPAPPRRVSSLQILAAVASRLDGNGGRIALPSISSGVRVADASPQG